jgi:hypothetical protein
MLAFVAVIAILNLWLGYSLAVYLGAGGKPAPQDTPADRSFMASHGEDSPRATHDRNEGLPPAAAAADQNAGPTCVRSGCDERLPATATCDEIARLLDKLSAGDPMLGSMPVALIEVDEDGTAVPETIDRMLCGVATAVREMLAETQSAARIGDRQLLLLLQGEDPPRATERTESIRQQIEATEFLAGETGIHATLTCAVGQLAGQQSAQQFLECLTDTLSEAKRFGGNRTFVHDGIAPGPAVAAELNCPPRKRAV